VTIGLTNGTNTEITAGLTEGQTIIIPGATASTTSTSATSNTQQGGALFFGTGGAGDGGGTRSFTVPGGR
ncbi:MAG: hypothetical protein ABSG55_08040, partial [Dehalococcoidia bacterium]